MKYKSLIIIPAYNESENLPLIIESIKALHADFDYVIINDGSTDGTQQLCLEKNFNTINLPINLGIGAAVQTGYKYAKKHNYEYAIQLDGDGQHDPANLNDLLTPLINKSADMVIGSRYIEKIGFLSSCIRRCGIKYFSWLIYLLTGEFFTDPTSGYRACNTTVINLFSENYPRDYAEPESIVQLKKHGLKVKEIPVKMKERNTGISTISPLKSAYYMFKVTIAILVSYLKPK